MIIKLFRMLCECLPLSLSLSLSAASRLGKTEPFAVSHLKLMKEDGTTIEDNIHELFVFKVS